MENVKMMQEKEERDGRSTLNTPVRDKGFLSRNWGIPMNLYFTK